MNENNSGFKNFILSPVGKAVLIVVLYCIIWGIMVGLTSVEAEEVGIGFAVVLGVFGWRALNRITPDMFLFMSITGWIIYFLIKGFLSIAIGMFVAPFVVSKMIATAIQESIE